MTYSNESAPFWPTSSVSKSSPVPLRSYSKASPTRVTTAPLSSVKLSPSAMYSMPASVLMPSRPQTSSGSASESLASTSIRVASVEQSPPSSSTAIGAELALAPPQSSSPALPPIFSVSPRLPPS